MNYIKELGLNEAAKHLNSRDTTVAICACALLYVVKYAIENGYSISIKFKNVIEINAVPGKKTV